MKPWVFMQDPLERWMADYRRTFDAWEEGGVCGLSFGYLNFRQPDGTCIPIFAPDPEIYTGLGVTPPPPAPRDLEKERVLHAMLDDAAGRGWDLLAFGVGAAGGQRPLEEDPFGAVGFAAQVGALMKAFPQVRGVIIDGPGEQHYELAYHHGGELFEIRDYWKVRFSHLGYDLDRLERGIAHLRESFHRLTPDRVRYHASGGMLGALLLFDLNEDALYWLRARQGSGLGYMQAIRKQLDALGTKVALGGIPRSAAFSSLTAQNYQQMGPLFDYLFPKHYFWHRGFDGMYGTVARWVQILGEWNPSLSEADCFAVVNALFGIALPGIHSLLDLELGFPQEFFDQVVYNETRRALEAVGDPEKVIAWVSTGRAPHAGDAMTARDLHVLLQASARAGLQRFLFHPDPDFGAAEWRVISSMCGKLWQEDPDGYWPSNTPRPDRFSGGRRTPKR